MPDFTLKPTFPMASVIDAAQRKAQLEQQFKTNANQQLVQGLDAIGQVGQSLVDKRMKVAQALALGKQFDIPDNIAKGMDPTQILQVGAIKKGQVDMTMLMSMLHPGFTPNVAPTATPASGTPSMPSNGAILASNSTATPIPTPSPAIPQPAAQDIPASAPVPIPAPTVMPKMVNKATVDTALKIAGQQVPVMTSAEGLAKGHVPKGTVFKEEPGNSLADKKEQDAYWRDAVRGLQSIRGDTAMKDIETQRNAAIQGYNRLKQIEFSGKAPNPIDYIDILGQVYKARTGTAPTQEVLKEAKQATSQAAIGKFWTLATGQQMPGTSKEIALSLKDMVTHMGLQADELHDGYMQVHGSQVFNPNMSEDNVKKLSKLSRGKSFADSTGVKAEDFDIHAKAIKWAQDNPNDPRSQPILQKALQEKSATSGGTIGL